MDQISGWWLTGAVAVAGIVLGVWLQTWRHQQTARKKKRIPARWPLAPRRLANTGERTVWRWLCGAFFDQHVMIKLPVTRFTLPLNQDESLDWYNLLSGVYCTLTVCTSDGRVVGCVDVAENRNISRSNRLLKQTLLSQCGIAYWTVSSAHLPSVAEIRLEFLGEEAAQAGTSRGETERDRYKAEIAAMRQKLSSAVARRRLSRDNNSALPASTSGQLLPTDSEFGHASEFHSQSDWQQPNSFVAPLDSRRAGLN